MLNRNIKLTPIISICIPTYNRCNKVYKLINNILLYQGTEIEVIVLDNCSTDETKHLLSEIKDPRFSFIQNEENIGGVFNLLKSLSLGSGKFSMLCLDKDSLDHRQIDKIIKHINLDSEVVFGHCNQNLQKYSEDVFYAKGYDSVVNMAYLSRHPTGMFYKTTEYNDLSLVKKIFVEKQMFPFYTDMINAEMAMIGKSQIINVPSFYTESKDEASKSPSFTYDVNNAYFSPAKRIVEFDTYLENAQNLNLSSKELFRLIFTLYGHELMQSTFGYRYMIEDDHVCLHNRIAKEKVGFVKLWKLNFLFTSHFFKKRMKINIMQKILIVLCWNTKFLLKSFLSK
ncbi:glycosyltransferase family 2 protein [Flavobacterium sp.]|uniref:glycosyltransferase family 2 protein n=1 Tax=Flavobacterium sp. TaxID=239 RepID=UPI00374C909D